MQLSSLSLGVSALPQSTLSIQVATILRKFGTNAHVWMPGVGVLNGFQTANYLEANASGAPQVVDQPVGYVGDGANVTLGPELSRYISAGSNWVDNGDGSYTKTAASWGGIGGVGAWPPTGKTFRILWRVASMSAGSTLGVYRRNAANTAAEAIGSLIPVVAGGTYSAEVTCVVDYPTANVWIDSNTFVGTIDNISVREITGAIPATQATTANKPILRRGHVNRLRNSTTQGAVVGTPGTLPTWWAVNSAGGLTTHVVAKGVEDGLDYIDLRIFGTASSTAWNFHFDSNTQQDTVPNVPWTAALSIKMVGGSTAGITGVGIFPRFGQSGGTLVNAGGALVPLTGSNTRLTKTDVGGALTAKVTQRLDMGLTNGAAIDVTIRIAAPQLETGSVANSFVPTTTAAASSNTGGYWWEFGIEATPNDTLTMAAPPVQISGDHFVAQAVVSYANTSSHGSFFVSDGASSRVASIYYNSGIWRGRWISGGTQGEAFGDGTPVGQKRVVGARSISGGKEFWQDGVKQGATNFAAVPNFTATTASLGAFGGGTFLTGGIYATIAIQGTVSDAEARIIYKWLGQQAGVTIT